MVSEPAATVSSAPAAARLQLGQEVERKKNPDGFTEEGETAVQPLHHVDREQDDPQETEDHHGQLEEPHDLMQQTPAFAVDLCAHTWPICKHRKLRRAPRNGARADLEQTVAAYGIRPAH